MGLEPNLFDRERVWGFLGFFREITQDLSYILAWTLEAPQNGHPWPMTPTTLDLDLDCLVVFSHPSEKYAQVKLGENLPQFSGWKKYTSKPTA